MVTLVDVPVMARGVFDLDQLGAALLLARFMVAVPFGAVAGGLLGPRAGRGLTAAGGLALAAAAYALMAGWDSHELTRRVGPFGEADLVLALAGFGFGIVIAPLAAAVIDLADAAHHALAASLVVLVRTFGMLLGLTALSAYGLHRFYQLFNSGPPVRLIPGAPDFLAQKHAYEVRVTDALTAEYHGIFLAAAALCIIAGLIALVSLSAWRMGGSTTRSR
jgi:MFS family permease